MLKVYFKQAIQMLRQNKFVGIISIAGTALAIMMIMTIVVVHEMKTLSVDPEPNRNRTLYISYHMRQAKSGGGRSTIPLQQEHIEALSALKTPEAIAALGTAVIPVQAEGRKDELIKTRNTTNAAYWQMFSHRFVEGRPYTEEEVRSGALVAVLSESLARQLYKDASPIGKGFVADFKTYRVIGVVEDVSRVFNDARGDCWVPYTTTPFEYRVSLLMRNPKEDRAAIEAEIRALEEQANVEDDTWNRYYIGPLTLWQYRAGTMVYFDPEARVKRLNIYNRRQIFILLVLLLVPALNLSGFSLSRVRKRMAEIGIRKAFGAKRETILVQILCENFITSLIGGLIGLVLAWVALLNFRHWLLDVPAGEALPLSVMVSPFTWLAVFAACFTMNLLSAGLPAWRATRMTIIHSINQNDKTI